MGLWVDSSLKRAAFICISSHGKKTTYRKETKWKRKRERERKRKRGKEHVIGWGDLEEWTELAKPLQDKSCPWDQVFWAGACPLVPLK